MNKLLAGLLLLSLSAIPSMALADDAPPPNLFNDVEYGDEGYWEIYDLKEAGIISGYADGSFKPNNTVNRAEFAKIVSTAAWDHDPSTDTLGGELPFSDINVSDWFEPYIHKLFTQNVISGYDDGTFKPSNTINFAEAAKVLVNSYECFVITEGYDSWWEPYTTKLLDLEVVPDSIQEDTSPWYAKEVTRVEMAQLVDGMEDVTEDNDGVCPSN